MSEKENPLDQLQAQGLPHVPKETIEKLDKIKKKLESFKKELLAKFDKYIMGITLLPPQKPGPYPGMPTMNPLMPMGMPMGMTMAPPGGLPPLGQPPQQPAGQVGVLVLVDDTDSKKMSKYELKAKLSQIIAKMAHDIDPGMLSYTIILSELWQNCYDGKYDIINQIAIGAPVYDTGMLAAIKISEIHKQMVLRKFERYIVSYVLAGSLVQGKATPDSDIDVFLVIDDTDVKKMTRIELKDKLRAIIIGMGLEAGEITGIKNKLNIQVYILTDFWDNIKEANPIIFTFLRDGIPLYDRGIFMPWKQLLRMGKIKPSPEAIDIFMSSGDQMVQRVQFKLNTIGMEDTFYAILTPSQAAIMLYGLPPPTPKETPEVLREIFVKKEKLLEDEYVKILEDNIQVRKELEHGGGKKNLTGKEVDKLMADAEKFLKRIKKLFKQIDKMKEEESLVHSYENTLSMMRDILMLEEIRPIKEADMVKVFEKEMIDTGKVPHKYLRMVHEIVKAKKDYDAEKLTATDLAKVKKATRKLQRYLVEHIQRKRGKEIEKATIRVKHGKKYGEIIMLGKIAFILHDIDAEDKQISVAEITSEGGLANLRESSNEELEKALAESDMPKNVFIKQTVFKELAEIFGKDVEISIKN